VSVDELLERHVVRGEDRRAEAFWSCEQPEDGVVEIGIGLRPDLVGRGLGERHVRSFERFGDHVFLPMERLA
jgi:hypothetical protein